MKASSDQMKFPAQGFTHGLMAKNMKANGKTTKCTDMEHYCGKTKENIKEIL